MRLTKQSELERLTRALDKLGLTYMRAKMTARDEEKKTDVELEIIMLGSAFNKAGKYLFACPVVNPMAGKNHTGQ